jgi:hypothetical protein
MVFLLYDDPSSATDVWSDTYDVPVANGAFSVVLPVPEAVVFGNQALYLGITVENVTLENRQRIYPALYATRNAPGGDFHVDANLGVGTELPETRLHLDSCTDVSVDGGGCLVVGDVGGVNLAMDHNEIMARDDGQSSVLYLNANNGDTYIGGGMSIERNRGSLKFVNDPDPGAGAPPAVVTEINGLRRRTFVSSIRVDAPDTCPDTHYEYCRPLTLASQSFCYVMEVHGVICAIRYNSTDGYWWLQSNRQDSPTGHQNQCVAGCVEWYY